MKPLRVLSLVAWVLVIPFMAQAQGEAQIPPNTEKIELSTESEAYQIGLLLRCPVCQGMPIADSPADMAQAMMKKIRTMTNEGRERQEILDYFVSRYGEWVLLEPKQEGLNWIIWIVPPLVLLLGILWAMNRARRAQSTPSGRGPTKPSSQSVVPESALQSMIRESVDGDDL